MVVPVAPRSQKKQLVPVMQHQKGKARNGRQTRPVAKRPRRSAGNGGRRRYKAHIIPCN